MEIAATGMSVTDMPIVNISDRIHKHVFALSFIKILIQGYETKWITFAY